MIASSGKTSGVDVGVRERERGRAVKTVTMPIATGSGEPMNIGSANA